MRAGTRLAVALCCVLVACGSGGGDRLTQAEYIEQADAICLRFHDQGNALEPPTSPETAITFLDQALALADQAATEFGALKPPEDGQAVHDALLSALRDSTAKIREARAALAAGDTEAANALIDEAGTIGGRADAQAKEYGYTVCGSESDLPD